ncbi:PLP-dependent transferase [Candidatus Vallotia tarda]|uniref:PLP-dependent transferase n=1 Tax=Candidatus Vallotiella hemipterorum TaxID=1177213 RepID=UPI003B968914
MIEEGRYALLKPSGLSLISNVYFAFVKIGADVLVPDNIYSPNREHTDCIAQNFEISVCCYHLMVGVRYTALIRQNTNLI